MCERNSDWSPFTHLQLGTKPATQACALTGNQTSELSVCGMMPNLLSHTSQGKTRILNGISRHLKDKVEKLVSLRNVRISFSYILKENSIIFPLNP